jgi:uncharacterized protein YukE
VSTRPQGTPYRLREMAGGFASSASNIRTRVAELEESGAGAPASWGWSGAAAAAYKGTWQSWRTGAQVLADRMDSSGLFLNHLADQLEAAQRAYDAAMTRAQALGLGVDARGYVTPRSVAPPIPLAPGSAEGELEAELATAATLGREALQWASAQLHDIFDKGWYEAIPKINDRLGWPTTPPTVITTATSINAGARYLQSARNLPGIASRLYSETVGPAALAYDRGDATYADLMEAARVGLTRMEWAKAFTVNADRASFLRGGVRAGGALDFIGKVLIPVAVVTDIATIVNPGHGSAFEQNLNKVASGANLVGIGVWGAASLDGAAMGGALLGVDAALGWVPVAGQVLLVVSGLVLAGIWAYDNVKPFHDFCNAAGSETVHVAQDAWNATTHEASNIGHSLQNAFGGAAHAVTSFFHWP